MATRNGREGHKSQGKNHHVQIEGNTSSVLKSKYHEISGFDRSSHLFETARAVKTRIVNELLKRGEEIPV